jgi:hypothetical protein
MVSSTGELRQHRLLLRDVLERIDGIKVKIQDMDVGSAQAPIAASLKWIEQSDLIIFLLGRTYGSLVPGQDKSYCEAEWDEARTLNKPCLAFTISDEHPIDSRVLQFVAQDGETLERQSRFREKVERTLTRPHRGFTSPEDLAAMVATAVSNSLRELGRIKASPKARKGSFHPPSPPAPYTPHVYTLSAGRFVGRAREIAMLNTWAETGSDPVFALIGLGGMGKTALAWHWLRQDTPKLEKQFEGVFWWSFYEENAGYPDFLAHALAYCTERSPEAMLRQSVDNNVRELIATLNLRRFLLCLDGLERIMHGYRNFDVGQAASDADVQSEDAGVAGQDVDALFVGHNSKMMAGQRYRRAVDRAGTFLQQVCGVEQSRVLVTSRLRPADLELPDRQFRSGVSTHERMRLSDKDALSLIRSLNVTGSSAAILRIANLIDNHPLTLRVLSGEIKNNKKAGRNLDQWLRIQSGFDPTTLQLVQRKTHILQIALRGLSATQVAALASIAAFRGPAAFEDLCRILIDYGAIVEDEDSVSRLLDELEDRLLVGHDQLTGAYDMHPIIRGLTWRGVGKTAREYIASLHGQHFGGLNASDESAERGLFVLQQMFFSLIELGRYDEAHELIADRIEDLVIKEGRVREVSEMLDTFIVQGDSSSDVVIHGARKEQILHDLCFCYSHGKRTIDAFQYEAISTIGIGINRRNINSNLVYLRNIIVALIGLAHVSDASRLWEVWRADIRPNSEYDLSHMLEVDGLLCLARGEHEAGVQHLLRFIGSEQAGWPPSWLATACGAALKVAEVISGDAPSFGGPTGDNLVNYAYRLAAKHGLVSDHALAAIYRVERGGLASDAREIAIARLQKHVEWARRRRLIQPEVAGLIALTKVALAANAEVAEAAARDLAEMDAFHDDFELQAKSWLAIARYRYATGDERGACLAARRVLWLSLDTRGNSSFVDLDREAQDVLAQISSANFEEPSFEPRPVEIVRQLVDRLPGG